MRILLPVAALLAVAACSGKASKEDQLNAAANQSTPAAAQVLKNAAENGMDANAAVNEAGAAQARNGAQTSALGNAH